MFASSFPTMRVFPFLLLLALVASACDSSSDVAELGSEVTLAYIGSLEDGTVFDQSARVTFRLDNGLIEGFRDGVIGMRVGEEKRLVIPPEKGYRDQQVGDIPPNSTLIFDVKLLDIR